LFAPYNEKEEGKSNFSKKIKLNSTWMVHFGFPRCYKNVKGHNWSEVLGGSMYGLL